MSLEQIDFSKTLTDDQVYESIMNNYSELANEWISHQWNWMNNVYWAFNDHYKYMIIISLIEKTLQFYDQMNIQQTYDEYYSKSYVQIDKFSITELCEKLDLPKETIRRKVLELEKEGVIKRDKKKIVIDSKAFTFVKPQNQIKLSSKYILLVAEALYKDKHFSRKVDVKLIESLIQKKIYIMLALVLSNANTINNWVSQIHARSKYVSCLGNYLHESIIERKQKFKKYKKQKITIRSWCCE